MDFDALLQDLAASEEYRGRIAAVLRLPPREARFRDLEHSLHPSVQEALRRLGVQRLWEHQARAVDLALDGRSLVVVSATASGKTLCYLLPLMEHLAQRPASRALLLYPTKALAQDQLRKLADFGAGEHFQAETYDGDTPASRRRRIKREAQVVLTNPDMLHVGILPYHHTWADFFRNLKLIVLDEVHVYRGVFGSHTANVLRRLRRIARHYGSNPQIICCSATIANPGELCRALTGEPVEVVDQDGSPQGNRTLVLWNPPPVDRRSGRRRSGNVEAAEWVARLMQRDVRSICFTLARRQAELILQHVRRALEGSGLSDKIMAYRGGYLPAERRQIEKRLFDGDLLAVTSTTALEVGVDIGGLDAAILAGYPGTVASTWQQIGRAGRGKQDALAVLVALPGGIHQYLLQHPEYLTAGSERALIDPQNRYILAGHLLCASYELAIQEHETALFGPQMNDILQILSEHRYVTNRHGSWYWISPDLYPAGEISIRSSSGTGYDIVLEEGANRRLLGTVDDNSAFMMVHEGAVYLHGGESYLVRKLDLERRVATVVPAKVNYYTVAMGSSEVRVDAAEEEQTLSGGTVCLFGSLSVKSAVIGYARRRQGTDAEMGQFPLSLPTSQYETTGLWLQLSRDDAEMIQGAGHDLMGSIHALEHALIALLPLFSMCDPHDVGGVSHSNHPDLGGPAIFLYDGHPGGVGICEAAYQRVGELLAAAQQVIAGCPCEDGCPSCVQAPDCGDGNRPLDKEGARLLAAHWAPPAGNPEATTP